MNESSATPFGKLSDAEVARFADQGYLAIGSVSSTDELAWFRRHYDDLVNRPRTGFLDGVYDVSRPYGSTDEPKLGQLLFPERFVDRLAETATVRTVRRIAAQLLDRPEDRLEMWTHLVFKPPANDNITPWHQDEAYWDVHLDYRSVASWLPLDDVDERNGCLWYVPGSHRREVFRHRHLGGDPSVHVLEVDESVDTSAAKPVPLAAGGLVLHHPRCLHFAGPNGTDRVRRAWGLVFQTEPVTRAEPADHPWWHEGRAAHAGALAGR